MTDMTDMADMTNMTDMAEMTDMTDINIKYKYLKYKTKYLQLQDGGSRRMPSGNHRINSRNPTISSRTTNSSRPTKFVICINQITITTLQLFYTIFKEMDKAGFDVIFIIAAPTFNIECIQKYYSDNIHWLLSDGTCHKKFADSFRFMNLKAFGIYPFSLQKNLFNPLKIVECMDVQFDTFAIKALWKVFFQGDLETNVDKDNYNEHDKIAYVQYLLGMATIQHLLYTTYCISKIIRKFLEQKYKTDQYKDADKYIIWYEKCKYATDPENKIVIKKINEELLKDHNEQIKSKPGHVYITLSEQYPAILSGGSNPTDTQLKYYIYVNSQLDGLYKRLLELLDTITMSDANQGDVYTLFTHIIQILIIFHRWVVKFIQVDIINNEKTISDAFKTSITEIKDQLKEIVKHVVVYDNGNVNVAETNNEINKLYTSQYEIVFNEIISNESDSKVLLFNYVLLPHGTLFQQYISNPAATTLDLLPSVTDKLKQPLNRFLEKIAKIIKTTLLPTAMLDCMFFLYILNIVIKHKDDYEKHFKGMTTWEIKETRSHHSETKIVQQFKAINYEPILYGDFGPISESNPISDSDPKKHHIARNLQIIKEFLTKVPYIFCDCEGDDILVLMYVIMLCTHLNVDIPKFYVQLPIIPDLSQFIGIDLHNIIETFTHSSSRFVVKSKDGKVMINKDEYDKACKNIKDIKEYIKRGPKITIGDKTIKISDSIRIYVDPDSANGGKLVPDDWPNFFNIFYSLEHIINSLPLMSPASRSATTSPAAIIRQGLRRTGNRSAASASSTTDIPHARTAANTSTSRTAATQGWTSATMKIGESAWPTINNRIPQQKFVSPPLHRSYGLNGRSDRSDSSGSSGSSGSSRRSNNSGSPNRSKTIASSGQQAPPDGQLPTSSATKSKRSRLNSAFSGPLFTESLGHTQSARSFR